ncbi:MAG: hypothetical protein ACFFA3_10365 [Promethearchaeota archaeon]
MPVELVASIVFALKKSLFESGEQIQRAILVKKLAVLLEKYCRIFERNLPVFDSNETHLQEFIDFFEIDIDDLRDNYYFLFADSIPYIDNRFFSYFFYKGNERVYSIEKRVNLAGDDLILIFALLSD